MRPRPAAASNMMVLLPAVILFYTVILPPEVRLSLGEQVLFAPRIIGFALLPWILWQLVRGQVRFVIWDYLFFFGSFWMVFAFMVYYGPADGVIRGGALAFDYTIPYLIGRICFKNTTDVRRFLIMVAPGLILAGLSMLMEVLASRPLVRPAFASIFGDLSAFQDGKAIGARESFIDRRLGILRANGPFAHPILAGVLLASFLPLYFFSGIRKWPFGLKTKKANT